jgi:ribosomal protein S17E
MLRDPSLIPLSQQHHNGLALCVMTRRSLAEDSSTANVARLARRAIDRYELELVNHFEMEEQVLFPVVQAKTSRCSARIAFYSAGHGLGQTARLTPTTVPEAKAGSTSANT